MDAYQPFSLTDLQQAKRSPHSDQTVRDIEELLKGSKTLLDEEGYHPDVAQGSNNLFVSRETGRLALVDVMPVYANSVNGAQRLIGDNPPQFVEHIKAHQDAMREVVGRYGA